MTRELVGRSVGGIRVSNFVQTAAGKGRRLRSKGRLAVRSASMSEADQFRQYAEEAKRWVRQSKTENEKQVLIELARTWTQAAAESERSVAVNYRAM